MNLQKLLLAAFLLSPLSGWAQAHLSVNEIEHNFGLITHKKPATTTFTVTNIGTAPLEISKVKTSCACTLVKWPKAPIAVGEKDTITVTYDAVMMGHFVKFVNIYSNSEISLTRLTLKGEVLLEGAEKGTGLTEQIGDLLLDTRSVEFEPVGKGEKPRATIDILNASKQSLDVQLMHLPPYLTMQASPRVLAPRRKGKIILTLETEKLKEYGLTQTPVYLARYPGDKVSVANEITVSSVLLPDFTNLNATQLAAAPRIQLSEDEVQMGIIKEKGSKTAMLLVTNQGKSKLEIKKLQVFNPAISLSLSKSVLKPGETAKLKLKLNGKHFYRFKSEPKILIITNDPEAPYLFVSIIAEKEKSTVVK